jgi:maltose alpha-D-glucosyltransferase/alpha-amylase
MDTKQLVTPLADPHSGTSKESATWYKDAIIYEVHVRAFFDSVTDGIGDFGGLTKKLDYLEDLGVTTIWLLPFCPSPLRDDGYDISNYTDIHPSYGTLRDFQRFLKEAHRRGLKVITELVLNHTSDQHVWFQRSRRAAPGSRWRNFYVWSDTPDKYQEARIIFKDYETSNWSWDPVANAYYWHRFYAHQPDLNFENPEVQQALFEAMDFWFDLGVDGLRLDAVPYLFEREGTSCENLPETHEFLRKLREHVESKYSDRMLLAEANQWPQDAVDYFGKGDECHMAFHFPLMPRLFMASRMEDRYPITDILRLTPPIPENSQWALFLRNHDELTLEMVTDEERDYMYRGYAADREMRINLGIRRRLAPLLENDRRKIELMNALLFSLPGTPVIYYGDEIGMGDNVFLGDRNGVRTPMQWSADRNAGFSRANPQRLYLPVNIDPEYHYEAVNVETQQNNPHSLLWWMKRIIAQRKQFHAFGRGSLDFLHPSNRRVVAFIRKYEDETILVVANLSRFTQCFELDLNAFRGMHPVEIFGRTKFPPITDRPYFHSLGPHAFNWFYLETQEPIREGLPAAGGADKLPELTIESWEHVFSPRMRTQLARLMPGFLRARRWFLGKDRIIRSVDVKEVVPIPEASGYMLLLEVNYSDADAEIYLVPASLAREPNAEQVRREIPQALLANVVAADGTRGVLYAGIRDKVFRDTMLGAITRRRKFKGEHGDIVASHTRGFHVIWSALRSELEATSGNLESSMMAADQSNSSIVYGNHLILKLFRKVESGINPDRELQEFLTEQASFPNMSSYLGAIEYRPHEGEPMTLGILDRFTRAQVNGWNHTIDNLSLFFERALALREDDPRVRELSSLDNSIPADKLAGSGLLHELIGHYLENVRLLGQRTAEMHIALSSRPDIPEFAPEPFTDFYRQSLYHGMLGRTTRMYEQLRANAQKLPGGAQEEAHKLISREADAKKILQGLRDRRVLATRIRHHGNLHLQEVLYTGKDFVFIDFEGDPSRPLSERRIKRSPLRDVAGMIRSFHYAAHAALYGKVPGVVVGTADAKQLERWANTWYRCVSATYIQGYLERAGDAAFIPKSRDQLITLLGAYVLEKAMIEVAHEIEHRPDWASIPIKGILDLIDRWQPHLLGID